MAGTIRAGAEKQSMAAGAKAVPFTDFHGHMLVEAVLNGKVKAKFVVDTGCPGVLLAASLAKQLGVDLKSAKDVHEVMVLNGKHKVGVVTLKSVRLGEAEAKDIQAEVLFQDNQEMRDGFKDGLLGLAFLNQFSVTVDQKKMKIALKSRQ